MQYSHWNEISNPFNKESSSCFACPFFQRDPAGLGQGKWKICAHGSWKEFYRVREHVYRKHILPMNYCDRCLEDQGSAGDLLLHRNPVLCEQKADLYRTADQIFKLKTPLKRGSSESEKWNNMYRILFPEDTHIPSPYKDEPSYSTAELGNWFAEIERSSNSTSLDVRTQIEQIQSAAESAIRSIEARYHHDEKTTQKFVNWPISFQRHAEEDYGFHTLKESRFFETAYSTAELGTLAAEIERISNSTSLDVRTQIEQIQSAAESATRSTEARYHHDEKTTQKFVNWPISFQRHAEESAQNKAQEVRAGIKADVAVKAGSWKKRRGRERRERYDKTIEPQAEKFQATDDSQASTERKGKGVWFERELPPEESKHHHSRSFGRRADNSHYIRDDFLSPKEDYGFRTLEDSRCFETNNAEGVRRLSTPPLFPDKSICLPVQGVSLPEGAEPIMRDWGLLSSGSRCDTELEFEPWKATEYNEITEPDFNLESPSLSPIIRCEELKFGKPSRLTTGFTNSQKSDIENENKATSSQNRESTSELQAKAVIRAVGGAVQEAQKQTPSMSQQLTGIMAGNLSSAWDSASGVAPVARAVKRSEKTYTEYEDELAFLLNTDTKLPTILPVERIEQLEEAEKSLQIVMDKGDQAIGFNPGLDMSANHNAATDDITMPNDGLAKSAVFATDSGYASLLTHNYKGPVPSTKMNESKDFHSNGSDINSTNLLDNEVQSMDDTSSVYTAGPDISPATKEAYISSLADDLLNKVSKEKLDEENLNKICKVLPRHLETFAMKVGSSDSALICREIMVFVRRYRNEIANSLRKTYVIENSVRSDVLGDNTAGMDFGDVISKWNPDPDLFQDPDTALNDKPDDVMNDNHSDTLDAIDRATDSLPELSAYRDFISMHPAYEWLVQSIQKELYMDMPGNVQANIRDTILGHLPRAQSISTREAPGIFILTFTADWDPVLFLKEQEYRESLEKALERAITITGSKIDAQAVTTTQYLQQTWPSSGIHLLHVVKHVVCDDSKMPFSYNLPDKTQLIAWSQGSEFKLEVTGTAESIADIGEQLAWIGSALRSSPHESGVTTVSAFVSNLETKSTSKMTEGHASSFFCNIGFNVDVIDDAGEMPNGQCWHQLFHNAVIVEGFPIPRRPKSSAGLEISLDTLASLTGTRYINTFNNKLFIKGFSTMLVPTRYFDNVLLWHLLCKKNGDRVSYLDGTDIHADNVSLPDLEKSRHILGWSSSIKYLVGSADANYNISSSWLTLLRESCKLENTSISKAQLIKSNHEAAIGKRERPPWIVRDSHRERLDFLSQKYMVLWDVGCKRGWLVNGVNALLHLLRASIALNKVDRPPPEFKLKEAKILYTVSAAREVLFNFENLDMELYDEYEQHESGAKVKFRVCDRVNDLFETLEKVIDYQKMIADVREKSPKSAPRKDLEGWDFKDIATSKSSAYYLRLAKLTTIGKGWVDFTRAIGAVFLFGRDFGNLMDPVPETSTCSHWEALPTGKFYLAASVEDLNTITERMGGNPTKTPPRLTDSLVWHPLNMALNLRCDCSTHTETHCERARAIWPKGTCPKDMSRHFPICSPLSLNESGAVVFGYSANLGWIWNDFGDPEKGELPSTDEESDDDNSADSGVGLSLRSPSIPEPQHAGQTVHSLRHEHYKVAIICALPEELMAVRALFDESHQNLPQHASDANKYALGSLGTYNVVAACLPSGRCGTNAASKVASDLEKSFPALKWYLVVGIGGGIPSREHDIRLGDVVVGNGVIQHDMGKIMQEVPQIMSTGVLERPDKTLLTAMSWVQSDPSLAHDALEAHIQRIVSVRPEYQSPGEDHDTLFYATSKHEFGQETCENCKGPCVPKKPRPSGPRIHYGFIASGNQVIKDAVFRDRIGAETKALCVEMEGAGVMETGNCLVIRGICDYADSHKNDDWHKYAAATAAAYAKLFLLRNPDLDMETHELVQTQNWLVSSLGEEAHGTNLAKRFRYHYE